MNEENTEILLKAYPNLYKKTSYFECGDGWFHLIDELSKELEPLCKENPEYYASQVKEKFGTLRFYMYSTNDRISKLIDEAELKSSKICEICSQPGEMRKQGWLSVLCDECLKKNSPDQS